jgi:hypothetical protein
MTDANRRDSSACSTSSLDEYVVEEIVKQRTRNGTQEFLIKWKGYPASESTWEPEENVTSAAEAMTRFLNSSPPKLKNTPARVISKKPTPENIFFLIPNRTVSPNSHIVIGYLRILLAAVSFLLLPTSPYYAVAFYFFSCLLDAVDGYAARLLDQGKRAVG